MGQLLAAKEVATRLGVSVPTVFRLADAGTLPSVEVAKRGRKRILRFRPEVVEEFITNCERVVCGGGEENENVQPEMR